MRYDIFLVQACPELIMALIRIATTYILRLSLSLFQLVPSVRKELRHLGQSFAMIVVICNVPKVGQMFNALGLGFSFVLSFLILPEEGDDESEGIGESKNGTDCSNSSLTLEDLTPVGCSPSPSLLPSFHSFICFPNSSLFCLCQSPLQLECL